MATAGLQEGIAQTMHVNCDGGATFYGRYFKCWVVAEHRTHGVVDISKAIYQSCDVFFYTLAEKLGIERIAKWATALGLGQKTGIDLPQEVTRRDAVGRMEDQNFKQKWYAGETISVGIGQGAVAATPIQMARAIGAIASGGLLVRPHVINPTDLPPNVVPASSVPEETHVPLDPQNWEIITDAMSKVVDADRNRAQRSFAGHRFRRKNRQRADHQQRAEGEAGRGRKEELQGQRMVCGRRAEAQSRDRSLHIAGRGRARVSRRANGCAGDQGVRREGAAATYQGCRRWREESRDRRACGANPAPTTARAIVCRRAALCSM